MLSAVSQIGLTLHDNTNSVTAFLGNVALFVPVMWAWVGLTFYSARFETDDLFHRLLVFLQMMESAYWALLKHQTNLRYHMLNISYEYIRAGRKIPSASKFARGYAQGFLISAMLWLISGSYSYSFPFHNLVISNSYRYCHHFYSGKKARTTRSKFFSFT